MRTLQEKYNAVLEGNFSKEQFRRDAVMQLPNLVSKFNSFEDMSTILKNRGMIAEAKMQQPIYSTAKPEDTIAPDVLDTGIKFELDKNYGTLDVTDEQYAKCREMAIKNLAKDVLYYVKQDSIQLDTPDEKMEKAKLNEAMNKEEAWEEYKKAHPSINSATEKGAYKHFEEEWNKKTNEETALDRAQDNAATKVQNALGDIADTVAEKPASVAAAFKKMVLANPTHYAKMSAHELEQEFEKFKLEEAQVEEGKSIELSDEEMEKLHKDGKITLPDGSVLHFVGKPTNEGDKKEVPASAYPENRHLLTPDELGYDVDEAKALKEAVKALIKKTLEA